MPAGSAEDSRQSEIGGAEGGERKAEQADEMFRNLVTLMGSELQLDRNNEHTKKQETPSWL